MSISIVNNSDVMHNLRDDWNTLALTQQNPLFDFDWYHSCATTLHSDDKLHLLISRDENHVVEAIAPLVCVDRGSDKFLELLGSSSLCEPSGMIFRDALALKSLYSAIAREQRPALLCRVPVTTSNGHDGPGSRFQSGLWLRTSISKVPVLEFGSDWNNFYQSLSKRRRADHRRAMKRAGARGDAPLEVHSPDRKEYDPLLRLAFDIEHRSWKGANGSSLKSNPSLAKFFVDYAGRAAKKGILRVFFQIIAGEAAAMAICVEQYDALWFLKIGYDERFKEFSPGMLQLMNISKYCCDRGIARIEHLGHFEPWLAPWTSRFRLHHTFIHYPFNLTGARLIYRDILGSMRRRISRSSMKTQRKRE